MLRTFCFLMAFLATCTSFAEGFQIPSKLSFKKELQERLTTLNQWIDMTNGQGFDLICFGESHNLYFRDLIAQKIAPQLEANVLAIEATPEVAEALSVQPLAQQVKVTGEDFSEVARAFFSTNPGGEVVGIEHVQSQKAQITFWQIDQANGAATLERPSRDSFIANNTDPILQQQDRILAVYGANHCTNVNFALGWDTPFMRQLKNKYGETKKLLNVHVVKPEEENLLRIYLKEFELFDGDQDLVLYNLKSLDPMVYNYREGLLSQFQAYDVLLFPGR